jgi:hypothetical protein
MHMALTRFASINSKTTRMIFQMLPFRVEHAEPCFPKFAVDPDVVEHLPAKKFSLKVFFYILMIAIASMGILAAQQPTVVMQSLDSSGTSGTVAEMVRLQSGYTLVCGALPDGQGFIAKYNACHAKLWQRGYQFGPGQTQLQDVMESSDGKLLVVGSCIGWVAPDQRHGMILELDSNGAMLNPVPIYVSQDSGSFEAIEPGLNGTGYVVLENRAAPFLTQQAKSWLHLFNNSHMLQWSAECHGYGLVTQLKDIVAVDGQGYFLSGWTGYNTFSGTKRMSFWKVGATGQVDWGRTFAIDTVSQDKSHDAPALDWDASSSTVVIGGHVYRDQVGESEECWIRVRPSDGQVIQTVIGNATRLDAIMDLKLDGAGNVYTCGFRGANDWFQRKERGRSSYVIYDPAGLILDSLSLQDIAHPVDHYQAQCLLLKPWSGPRPHFLAAANRSGVLNGQLLVTDFDSCLVALDEMTSCVDLGMKVYPTILRPGAKIVVDVKLPAGIPAKLRMVSLAGTVVKEVELPISTTSISLDGPQNPGLYILQMEVGGMTKAAKIVVQN